jgi:hypothetical protein
MELSIRIRRLPGGCRVSVHRPRTGIGRRRPMDRMSSSSSGAPSSGARQRSSSSFFDAGLTSTVTSRHGSGTRATPGMRFRRRSLRRGKGFPGSVDGTGSGRGSWASRRTRQRTRGVVAGRVFSQDQVTAVAAGVRRAIGEGPTVERRHESGRRALIPTSRSARCFRFSSCSRAGTSSGRACLDRVSVARVSGRAKTLRCRSRGAWRSLVSALVWGTRGPEFESRRPD